MASSMVYRTDSLMRATTLHELVESTDGEQFASEFVVQSPHVSHELLVAPVATVWSPADAPLRAKIQVTFADGTMVLEEYFQFEVRRQTLGSSRRARFDAWETASFTFTPQRDGRHELRITAVGRSLPKLHVRVEDPTMTNGQRAVGY